MQQEERKNERTSVLHPVEYFLAPSIINNSYDGVVIDISDSGACLITSCPLKERQRIIIRDKSSSYEKAAIVRWTQKYDDMFFKIGVEYLEDQAFMNIRDKRRYKRLDIRNLNIHGRMVSAHYIKILDMSIGGLLIETDRNWNIGEEYILHVECEGKQWPVRGYVTWSVLKEPQKDNDSLPRYRAGMKLTSPLREIHELLRIIRLKLKHGEKNEYFSLRWDKIDAEEKEEQYAENSPRR